MTDPAALPIWPANDLDRIAETDNLHIAPERPNRLTGTPTWIWSVAVERRLYVRPYRGAASSWYHSALQTGVGIIRSAGTEYRVRFTPVNDPHLIGKVDAAYEQKYTGSAYLPPMVSGEPRQATVAVTPANNDESLTGEPQ